ncbi:MAG: response regulator [Candidatus Omnitrophica bacterium]|nr:response regulator [Candidatus Omnitrophota bacterium]
MIKILVVDDEQLLRDRLKGLLELEDYEVCLAESGLKGLEVFNEKKPDIIVSDIKMPGMDGIQMLEKIKALGSDVEVIMLTGHGGIETAIQALKIGAFDYMNKPVNFDELCVNITRAIEAQKMRQQLKSQQSQLLQAAKLNAVGELGAGVAHEMNQPLMAIASHLEVLLMNDVILQDAALKTKILKIKDQFARLGTIVKRMHEYSGSRKEGFIQEDVNRPITDGLYLMSQQLKDHNIELTLELEKDLPVVHIDRYQIQDVIINFLVNARDAVDERHSQKEGGHIWLMSKKMKNGKGIIAGVIDNGIPVKSGSEDSIFNPFFTTKAPGKGTGLGLSVSYNIMKSHKGVIGFTALKNDRKLFYCVLPIDKNTNLTIDPALNEELKSEWETL